MPRSKGSRVGEKGTARYAVGSGVTVNSNQVMFYSQHKGERLHERWGLTTAKAERPTASPAST